MPAAVPMLGAAALSALAQYATGKSAQKLHDKQIGTAQDLADENYRNQLAWQSGVMPQLQDVYGMSLEPQVSESNMFGRTSTNMVEAPELTALGKPVYNMLLNRYMGDAAAANFVPEGLLQAQFGDIAAQEQAGRAAESNLYRSRGIDSALANSLSAVSPAARMAQQAKIGARQEAERERLGRGQVASANLQGLLQALGIQRRQKGTTTQRQSGTTTGPANVGGALAALEAMRPPEKDIIV